MSETMTYSVPAIHCEHCVMSVREELSDVAGVSDVVVDLDTKLVTVSGSGLEDSALRAAIQDAGYDAA